MSDYTRKGRRSLILGGVIALTAAIVGFGAIVAAIREDFPTWTICVLLSLGLTALSGMPLRAAGLWYGLAKREEIEQMESGESL